MSVKKIKLCFFLGGFHQNGGIGRVTSMLANEMNNSGKYDVTVLCYYNPHLPNIYPLESNINQMYFLEDKASMTKVLVLGGVKRLRKIMLDMRIDVIIACGALYYPIVTLACEGISTKAICWEHSDPNGNSDHKGQYLARRFGIKKSDLNVVLTKSALDVYKNQFSSLNTIQIYNPIDQALIEHAGDYDINSKRIISVGRLTYQKNFQEAVRIAEKVLHLNTDWHWDIYGKGDEFEELESMIKTVGLNSQMHLCGQVDDLYNRYKEYSFMVMTSRYEGFPMTLLEGIGNGLPLVSYDIPTGPNEIIENNVNGYLINNHDRDGMINAILNLINDVELRRSMSMHSFKKCTQFLINDIYIEWDNAIHQII